MKFTDGTSSVAINLDDKDIKRKIEKHFDHIKNILMKTKKILMKSLIKLYLDLFKEKHILTFKYIYDRNTISFL